MYILFGVQVYQDVNLGPVERDIHSVLTPDEMYEQQKLSTLDLHYRRLPLNNDHTLKEEVRCHIV